MKELLISNLQTGLLAALATVLFIYGHPYAGSFMFILAALSLTTIKTGGKS